MIELFIIGILVAAIAGYVLGHRDGQVSGFNIMRDEYDERRKGFWK